MMLPAEHAVAAVAVACDGGGSGATVEALNADAAAPVLATVEAAVCSRFDDPDDDTVDNCSWISIIWSPSLIVRFNGALPDRKSLTCDTYENQIIIFFFLYRLK